METLTRLDLFEIGRSYVKTRARRIDPAQVDVAGSDINLYVGGASYMSHAVVRHSEDRFATLWLDSVDGEDLDRWGYDRYRQLRKGAAPARTTLKFERPTVAGGAGAIDRGRKFKTQTGIEYITTQQATFGPTDLSKQVYARAVQAGKAYQVGANTIRQPASGQLFDTSIIITNPEPAAGGEERESDDLYRERLRDFWQAMSKGTLGAIAYGARAVPGIESAVAFEVDEFGIPARVIELFLADGSGVCSSALSAAVMVELEEWRGGGIYVIGRNSIPQIIDITLALQFQANVDTVTVGQQVANAVMTYVNSLGVNQPLLVHDLGGVFSRFKSAGLIPSQGTVVSPVGDLIPDRGKTLRMRPENLLLAA